MKNKVSSKDVIFLKLASTIIESPKTGNACHVISFPFKNGEVVVNDLDMGVCYRVKHSSLSGMQIFRPVEPEDFQFSWVLDVYNEDLYRAVAALTPENKKWDV